jgi:diaminopimelate decarboxylase
MYLKDNQYFIQDIKVEDLVKEFETPVFVYDGNKIEEQISKMRNAFKGVNLKLKYACKALTNINILKIMLKNGVDIDVVSIEEAKLALKVGYVPKQIQYTPSGVSFNEVQEAVSLGLRINLDSIPLLQKFGETYGNQFPIAIRLNPSIMAGGNLKISTGHADSKFGISIEQIEEVVSLINKFDLNVVGLHQHNGSDFKNGSVIIEAAKISFETAKKYFPNIEFLDMGSGFKVAYSEDDHVTDIEEIGKEVVSEFNKFVSEYGKDVELWFEPGKFLVSECGVLLVNANVIKHNPSRSFVHVDSGLNHLIRPMMYDAYHDIKNVSNTNDSENATYDVVGYICETDTFGKDRNLPIVNEGDTLGILNAGAYCFSMSSNYNSRVKPSEVLIYNNKVNLIRERETFDDILRHQIELPI